VLLDERLCQPAGVFGDLQDADVLERRQSSRRRARITPTRLGDDGLRDECDRAVLTPSRRTVRRIAADEEHPEAWITAR
jgi:hypothetical protein